MVCEICGSKMYNKIEDTCSLTKCTICDNVHLNGIGLPVIHPYHKANDAVFSTIKAANKAMKDTFISRFHPDEWGEILQQWHDNLHNNVIE